MNLQVAPGLRAHADAHLLEVLLGNLLENAWKSAARGVNGYFGVDDQAIRQAAFSPG